MCVCTVFLGTISVVEEGKEGEEEERSEREGKVEVRRMRGGGMKEGRK